MLRYKKHNNTFFVLCYTLCLFLALSFCLSFVKPQDKFVIAADTYWSDHCTPQTEPIKDSYNFYQLKSAEDVAWFFYSSGSKQAVLYCDIDMSKHVWDGPTVTTYRSLNGKGHIIQGLKFKNRDNSHTNNGLIATAKAKDLISFSNISLRIEATQSLNGCFGAFVGEQTENYYLSLTNCDVYGTITNTNDCSSRCVGGLVGKSYQLYATNCCNYATINGNVQSNSVGGIAGYVRSSCKFELTANTASILGNANYVGGLSGYVCYLTLSNARCYNSGAITNNSTSGYAGGLFGVIDVKSNIDISYVYNTGLIVSSNYGGGLIGGDTTYNESTKSTRININNAYNSGIVKLSGAVNQGRGSDGKPTYTYPTNESTVIMDHYQNVNSTPLIGEQKYSYYSDISNAVQIYNGGSDNPLDYQYYVETKVFGSQNRDISIIGFGRVNDGDNVFRNSPQYKDGDVITPYTDYQFRVKFICNSQTIVEFFDSSKEIKDEVEIDVQTAVSSSMRMRSWYGVELDIGRDYSFPDGYSLSPNHSIYSASLTYLYNTWYYGNGDYRNWLQEAYLRGVGAKKLSNGKIAVMPLLYLKFKRESYGYYNEGYWYMLDSCDIGGTYEFEDITPLGYQTDSEIMFASFAGSYFARDNSYDSDTSKREQKAINSGYPYFPEMYW